MKKTLALALALLPGLAWGQASVRQNGSITERDLPAFVQDHVIESARKLLSDTGYGLNPFTITDSSGTGITLNSTIASSASNSVLRLGHDSSGNGAISYTGTGSLQAIINGTAYPFFGSSAGNVLGPNSSTAGNITVFNSTDGKLIKQIPNISFTDVSTGTIGNNGGNGGTTYPPSSGNYFTLGVYNYSGSSSSLGVGNSFSIYGRHVYMPAGGGTDTSTPIGIYGQLLYGTAGTYTGIGSAVRGHAYTDAVIVPAIATPGTGYAVGDILTASGGTCPQFQYGDVPLQYRVASVSAGAVTGVERVIDTGICKVYPTNPVSFTGGAGSGLTVNLTFGSINISNIIGGSFRARHQALGAANLAIAVKADGCSNAGVGSITNCVSLELQPPYDQPVTKSIGLYQPTSAFCTPNCFQSTILTDDEPITFWPGGNRALSLLVGGGLQISASAAPAAPAVNNLNVYYDQADSSLKAKTSGGVVVVLSTAAASFPVLNATPASAAAVCTQGQLEADAGFIYFCTATNTWKRVAIATW